MTTTHGELRFRPEDCLAGDWICAKMVTGWDWSADVRGHALQIKGEPNRFFEILPYFGGERRVVWRRVS